MKIVINTCFGGFSLSNLATIRLAELKGITLVTKNDGHFQYYETLEGEYYSNRDFERNDPDLVRVVEELGDAANGSSAELEVIEIPDEYPAIQWHIEEYDGREHVAEDHRTWN